MSNLAWFIVGALISAVILEGLDSGVSELVEPTVLDVDGVECWFENYPVLKYRVKDQAVDVMITCKIDIINHYLPAIERTQ